MDAAIGPLPGCPMAIPRWPEAPWADGISLAINCLHYRYADCLAKPALLNRMTTGVAAPAPSARSSRPRLQRRRVSRTHDGLGSAPTVRLKVPTSVVQSMPAAPSRGVVVVGARLRSPTQSTLHPPLACKAQHLPALSSSPHPGTARPLCAPQRNLLAHSLHCLLVGAAIELLHILQGLLHQRLWREVWPRFSPLPHVLP